MLSLTGDGKGITGVQGNDLPSDLKIEHAFNHNLNLELCVSVLFNPMAWREKPIGEVTLHTTHMPAFRQEGGTLKGCSV